MTTQEKIYDFQARCEKILAMGGDKAVEKQHGRGKFTARERLDMLFDEGTFKEVDRFVNHRCNNFGMVHIMPMRKNFCIFVFTEKGWFSEKS